MGPRLAQNRNASRPETAADQVACRLGLAISVAGIVAQKPGSIPALSQRHVVPGASWNFATTPVLNAPLAIQPKLEVGAVDDPLEREADAVAEQVMRVPGPQGVAPEGSGGALRRKCSECENEDEEARKKLARKESDATSSMGGDVEPAGQISQGVQPKLYREVVRLEDVVDSVLPPEKEPEAESPGTDSTEEVQRSASGEAGALTPHFEQSLHQASRRGGEALPAPTRSFMESRFGWNFSSVRVHSDAQAHNLARDVSARAFTLDNNIFFARSQYQPDRPEGQRLLAHELTHVVQQSAGRISRQVQRTSCSSYPAYDASVDLKTYNCAGLATRTYKYTAPASAAYDLILANFVGPGSPAGSRCDAGAVKFWLWEYDMHTEDDLGNKGPDNRDFHVVAGRADASGADPANVYSKNGARQVKGPGTGPSFKPAAKERALSNDPSETPSTTPGGRPIFKVRSNMSEDITCAGCNP